MNRKLTGVILSGVALVGLTACATDSSKDVKGIEFHNPTKMEGYNNVDGHPNIVRLCIDGVAFMTTTREYEPSRRVPEWDGWCKS